MRAAALAFVWLAAAAGVGVSLGLPAWVAAPPALAMGVLATVAILRALDDSRDARAAEELAILVRIRDLVAPGQTETPGPESVEALASIVGMERSRHLERAERFEAIINAIDAPTIAVDATGRIFHSNGPANELFGGPLSGRTIEEAFTQPDLVALPIAARRGAARRARIRVTRPTGAILLDVAAAPFGKPARASTDEGESRPARHGVVMTMRDVTELAAAAQLKTDFVANASHELRTPLASIRAAVETIQDHGANDPETRDRFLRHFTQCFKVEFEIEMSAVANDRSVFHDLKMLTVDNVTVAGNGNKKIADLRSFGHRKHAETVHNGLDRLDRIDLGNDDVGTQSASTHCHTFTAPAVTDGHERFAGKQNVRGTDHAVQR